jgi:glycogen operon protein
MTQDEWGAGWIRCFGAMLDGRCRKTAIARHGEDESVLIIMNSADSAVDFKLPHTSAGPQWTLLLDTNLADGASATPFAFDSIYKVAARTFALLTSADEV